MKHLIDEHAPLGALRRASPQGVVLLLLLPLCLAGGLAALRPALARGCPDGVRVLRAAATPEVAPVVAEVARTLTERDGCRRVDVTARASAAVLDDLSRRPDAWDVWLPDSSIWVDRAQDAELPLTSVAGPIASSPVVLALPTAARPLADAARFSDVLRSGAAGRPLRLAWPDPQRSAPAVAALLGLHRAARARAGAEGALAGLLRAARTGLPARTDRFLGRLAVPVAEQSAWAYNATAAEPVEAAYTSARGSALDYPFVVTGNAPGTIVASARLLAHLGGEDGRRLLQARGFRDPAGRPGAALLHVPGIDPEAGGPVGTPTTADLAQAGTLLQTLTRPSRLLAVVDVSGSMGAAVPGVPGTTRLGYAMDAAAAGLSLLPAGSDAGLWEFSTNLGPGTDHREVVPLGPVTGRHAEELSGALTGLEAVPGGGTGLYDTTLAAVRRVRAHYDPSKTNAVVLLTDGADSDTDGLDLAGLLDRLRAENRPGRPVPVIAVAYGKDGDAGALRAISDATGGTTYASVDPRRIRTVLLDAIAQRLCRPYCPPSVAAQGR